MSNDRISINIGGWPLLITALLCVLKLTGVINISWWWCFCLFWLPFVILFAIATVFLIALFVIIIISIIQEFIRR